MTPDVRKGDTVVLAGTRKGLFVLHARTRRGPWRVRGPHFAGNEVPRAVLDPTGRTVLAGVHSGHWGSSVRRSTRFGDTWSRPAEGPRFPEGTGLSVSRVWQLAWGPDGDVLAGTEPAGLFRSDDGGRSWTGLQAFNAQPDRHGWMPGGGGLCLHTIVPWPGDPRRMVVAASAVGVFGTGDAGASWRLMNGGIRAGHLPGGATREDEAGSCPHKVVRDARDPAILYMQNHFGVYRRRKGDTAWTEAGRGLPSRFGFAMVAHPHDGGTVYTAPMEADSNRVAPGGAFAVHRTTDGGRSWTRLSEGLPQQNAWHTVLRDAMATDGRDPAGVYVGTTTGQLYASADDGDTWRLVADRLPPILSVDAGVAGR